MKINFKLCLLLFLLLNIPALSVNAASFQQADYAQLIQEAQRKGFAQVMLEIDIQPFLNPTPAQQAELADKEAAILAELGDTISASGQWRSGFGQIAVYATVEGLKRIVDSLKITNFWIPSGSILTIYDVSGHLINDVETEILNHKFADVEVVLNLENVVYEFIRDGSTVFKTSPELSAEILAKLPAFLDTLPPLHTLNLTNLQAQLKQLIDKPVFTLRIDMEGLFALQIHKGIRAMRLANALPVKPKLDIEVIETAKKHGFADVQLLLRQPFGYSPQSGRLPAKAQQAQNASIETAFKDVFAAFGTSDVKNVQLYKGFLNAYARLSLAALKQLYLNPDPRLEQIKLNNGVIEPATNTGFTPLTEIVPPEPTELCINAVAWSGDLTKTSIQYFLVVRPEDHFKEGDMFLAYRPINKPAELWFHSLTRGGSVWTKSDPQTSPAPYNTEASFKLKPIFRMQTGKDFDAVNLANNAEPGEIIVGYGVGATPEDSFQDMFKRKTFETIWQSDTQNTTDYAYCLDVTKIKKTSSWAPNVLGVGEDSNINP